MRVLKLKCNKCGKRQKWVAKTDDLVMNKYYKSCWSLDGDKYFCQNCADWLSGEEMNKKLFGRDH